MNNTNDTNTNDTAKRERDKRTDVLLKYPEEVCLFGGATMLDPIERGFFDTKDDPSSPYHDPRLLLPLDLPMVRNVNLLGVLETVLVTRVDDVLIVIAGRQRIRWARAANRMRAERGEPLIRVKCDPVRLAATDKSYALAVMIAENEGRRDDDIHGKIEKLKRLLASGIDTHAAADYFGTSVAVIDSWLRFDDNAIGEVKSAVEAGRLALSAGMRIAALVDPAKQTQVMADLAAEPPTSNGKISVRHAAKAAKRIEKPDAHVGVTDKKTQRALLKLIENKNHKGATKEQLAWWSGVEAALTLVCGSDEKPDERLLALLGEAMTSSKETK
jgi:hypothetical protein